MKPGMLHRRVREGELLVGALLRMPAEETTEQVAAAGVDYIVVDCEHGPDGVVELRQHICIFENERAPGEASFFS